MNQSQLKCARDAVGMKQWELGIALGVSEAEVCLWEKGKRTMPERYLRLMGAIIHHQGLPVKSFGHPERWTYSQPHTIIYLSLRCSFSMTSSWFSIVA